MESPPRVGVGIIVWNGDGLLLVRRAAGHGSGTWSTPGGHLDHGEALERCAAREALEETGIEVTDVRFRAITNDHFEDEGKHYLTVWMEGDHEAGDPTVAGSDEISDAGWFSRGELPGPLFLPLRNLLEGRCYPAPGDHAAAGIRR